MCLASCQKQQLVTPVKLVAIDALVKNAKLFIDGQYMGDFSEVDETGLIDPCVEQTENFPIINLEPNNPTPSRSFYEFTIISQDYNFQQQGTIVLDDGNCKKWEIESKHLRPVADERFDVQGLVMANSDDFTIKVYDDASSNQAILKVLLNENELVSNFNATKEDWESDIELEFGMNYIAIESILEGDLAETAVEPTIEISKGDEVHRFNIQSFNDRPGAFLIACPK